MKKIVSMLFVALLTSWTVAEVFATEITGKVTDADSQDPIIGCTIMIKGTQIGTITDINGTYSINVSGPDDVLVVAYVGYISEEIKVGNKTVIDVQLSPDMIQMSELVVIGYGTTKAREGVYSTSPELQPLFGGKRKKKSNPAQPTAAYYAPADAIAPDFNTEGYTTVHENEFLQPTKNPLSTFSIDVDAASYSNVRRYLNNGQRPPVDAVRIEEMINYFTYDYPQPTGEDPFSVNTEISECPWNTAHKLVHIGLQGKKIATDELPPSNLVFLIDVSGSMSDYNKLPLLKQAFKMLVNELREEDRVAMVVYAGAAGLVLPSTPGNKKDQIINALDNLEAGGSTAGGAGLKLAYQVATENFREKGNNRIILATDGDFNIGASSNAEMERMIEQEREKGIFMTVLGFGMGNYKDDKMEIIADKGNGNYAYIDNVQEAKKVFVNEFGGTLFTIAKDVKLQIEFNPTKVEAYRLIGYENRKLNDEDFNDDKKDAGELGSGHTVTALYEIIPKGVKSDFIKSVDDLKYQENSAITPLADKSEEIMTIKLRYKAPDGKVSKLIEKPVIDTNTDIEKSSNNFRWSAAVAKFGMLLRDSKFKQNTTYESVLKLARGARGEDEEGYRRELVRLIESSRFLASK